MIKHWEILENKWTQDSAYVLCIEGDDADSTLILKELSSFCKLVNIKVSSFSHVFELLNVTDDDILQKIRSKIETIVAKSSSSDKEDTFTSNPVRMSEGGLAFSTEDLSGDNLIMKPLGEGDGFSSSSDGLQISIEGAMASKLEDTKTNHIEPSQEPKKEEAKPIAAPQPVKEVPAKEEKKSFAQLTQQKINEVKQVKEVKQEKEEKQGFFKRLFSFGKKKSEPKKQEAMSEPLPIETKPTKVKNIVPSKEDTFHMPVNNNKKSEKKEEKKNAMHGVIVKGTAFPSQEMGIPKVKEVSLDSKSFFEKDQNTDSGALQSQVPLDDIFAAETICQFYDEGKDPSGEPKIEKIVEPTPMPTPKIIPITQNKVLEDQAKQADRPSEKPAEIKPLQTDAPKAIMPPEAPIKKETPVTPKAPITPIQQKPSVPQQPVEQVKPTMPKVSPSIKKVEEQKVQPMESKNTQEEKPLPKEDFKKEKPQSQIEVNNIRKDIPTISVSAEDTFKVKNPIVQEQPKTSLPKVEVESKALEEKIASLAKAATAKVVQEPKKTTEVKTEQAPKTENKAEQGANSVKQQKPIPMPHIDKTSIDGFDHTIQTSFIPVNKKSNWAIEMPIVPSYTLDSMDMSSNRFAHAAAMSIIENPGTMYNPFFVFGESGCGKTHFLNAIGVEYSKKLSQDQIFITNGVRFSRGVQRAIEDGSIDKVRGFLDTAQVLIIDDIHLTAVNEINREFISQVLNDFIEKRKQLIISSKYPPQGLSRFEELTDFQLSQGWVSELKTLRPNHFIKVYTKMAEDAQIDLSEAQCRGFFGRENLTLGMINRDIKRAKVLRRRIKDSGNIVMSYEQLFNYITAISGEDTTSQLESLDLSSPLSIRRGENTNWGNFGFFFPKESADKFKWIVYATMRRAKELNIKGGFNFALKSAYSTEHIIASAFKIANVCDSKSLKAAIILGPDPKIIQPAIRDNFCDILSHMLEVMMIRCAIIPYEDIKKPSSYVRVLGDVLK